MHSARAGTEVWCTVHVITDTNFQHFSAAFNTRLPLLSYVTGFLTAQSDKPSFIYRLQAAMLCSAHQQHACAAFTSLFAFQVNAGSGGRWEGGQEGRGLGVGWGGVVRGHDDSSQAGRLARSVFVWRLRNQPLWEPFPQSRSRIHNTEYLSNGHVLCRVTS